MTGVVGPEQRENSRNEATEEKVATGRTGGPNGRADGGRLGRVGPTARTAVDEVLERSSGPQAAVRELLGESALLKATRCPCR
ncbi:hypothetical protein [Kitasatospora sp. NPDC097691]|uniref:hypothetical protein n=1 Tax=Kitasatospora sp. NPDC097691 TaxID=3157231 RepID=UPI003320891F